jgi:hypothetical protein
MKHRNAPLRVALTSCLRLAAGVVLMGFLPATESLQGADDATAPSKAQADFLAMRTQAVMQMDGGFLRGQIELFVATRIAAEDAVMAERRRQPGGVLLPGMLSKQMDAALAGAFDPEVAKRYRVWMNDSLGRDTILHNPVLRAKDWLTPEEQRKLARAWGPIVAAAMDVTFHPKFQSASREEKRAFIDRLLEQYDAAAADVLDAGKLAELKKRLVEMRAEGLKELNAGPE